MLPIGSDSGMTMSLGFESSQEVAVMGSKEAPMSYNLSTPEDVLRLIKDEKIQGIDLRFTDLSGLWQHFLVPSTAFDLESVGRGVRFDGYSISRVQGGQEGDMLALPDPMSAFLDPFAESPTLVLICNIRDPIAGQSDTRDPRHIAQKAEAYLQTMQIGDTANFGLEFEDFVFDEVRDHQSTNDDHYAIRTAEANWSTARGGKPEWGHIPRRSQDYFAVPPADILQDIRTQVGATLEKIGVRSEAHHREIATRGRGEIGMRFATLSRMADNVMIFKYVVDNVARQRGMNGSFVLNAMFGGNGSGTRVHQSIWQGERPLFAGDGYAGSSALMRHYIAGLLAHAPALLEICEPMAAPWPRRVPVTEAPVNLACSQSNRAVECHIPIHSASPTARRVGFRCADPSCNPYLAFAAMLMAGIDGFHNRLYGVDPDEPIETRYNLPPLERAKTPSAPRSLDALEADQDFLLKGDVFTPDLIETISATRRCGR
jgi:glutamine synthetase